MDVAGWALAALWVSLPLGATPHEIVTGGCGLLALWLWGRDRERAAVAFPLAGPVLVLALGWSLLVLRPDALGFDSLRRWGSITPAFSVPVLLHYTRWRDPGLGAAAAMALLAPLAAWQWWTIGTATGLYSHHLTLAYALVPAFAAMVGRRHPLAVVLGAMLVFTTSLGALFAGLTVVLASGGTRPRAIAGGFAGLGVALGGLSSGLVAPAELHDRAVLWTAGAEVAVAGGTPYGTWRAVIAPIHRSLAPGFEFPQHAHNSLIQMVGDAGPGAWAAAALTAVALWRHAEPWLLAAAAGLTVAALTQDWVGDLEVLRAALLWGALGTATRGTRPKAEEA